MFVQNGQCRLSLTNYDELLCSLYGSQYPHAGEWVILESLP